MEIVYAPFGGQMKLFKRTPTCNYADSKYGNKRHGGAVNNQAVKFFLAAFLMGFEGQAFEKCLRREGSEGSKGSEV